MAWLRKFSRRCEKTFCNRAGSWEVVNDRNASLGVFCRKHAEALVEELERKKHDLDQN